MDIIGCDLTRPKSKTRLSIALEAGLNDLRSMTCGPDGCRTVRSNKFTISLLCAGIFLGARIYPSGSRTRILKSRFREGNIFADRYSLVTNEVWSDKEGNFGWDRGRPGLPRTEGRVLKIRYDVEQTERNNYTVLGWYDKQ